MVIEKWIEGLRNRLANSEGQFSEQQQRIEALEDNLSRAEAQRDGLLKLEQQLRDLVNESQGVTGLHLNGDDAPWDWLIENEWLSGLAEAVEGSLSLTAQVTVTCEPCQADDRTSQARYALSLADSNSAANICLACGVCFRDTLDHMLSLDQGSVDVQRIERTEAS